MYRYGFSRSVITSNAERLFENINFHKTDLRVSALHILVVLKKITAWRRTHFIASKPDGSNSQRGYFYLEVYLFREMHLS